MATQVEFLKAVNSAVVLNSHVGTQAVVKGLNSLTMPVESRDLLTFETFGVDFETQEVGSGKRSAAEFSGYALLGDSTGQAVLEAAMVAQTKMKDVRFYFDTINMHFRTLDLANDSTGFFQVSKAGPDGAAGKNDAYKFAGQMPCGGPVKTFAYHATGTDISFVATGSKITSTSTDFVAAGFVAGRTLIIDGSAANEGFALITSVAANEMVIGTLTKITSMTAVTTGIAVVDEAASASITLHASTY